MGQICHVVKVSAPQGSAPRKNVKARLFQLTFKLVTQEGTNLVHDIFATDVIAKDPYTQRTIELIDTFGCPVDPAVFPALGISRTGEGQGLEVILFIP